MGRLRRWFLRHWFAGVYLIIGGVWLITEVAYLAGARRITFPNPYGEDATINFMREHERPVLAVSQEVGLEIEEGGGLPHGSLRRYHPAPPVLCWLCGEYVPQGGIVHDIAYRRGSWFFRAVDDSAKSSEARHGRKASRDYILTVAYNSATAERVIASVDASPSDQQHLLTARGLAVTEAHRLSPATHSDLRPLSVMHEGCAIFNVP